MGDIVTHIEYDQAGRTDKSFIPYLSQTTSGSLKLMPELNRKILSEINLVKTLMLQLTL
jgi:hypothetical protein